MKSTPRTAQKTTNGNYLFAFLLLAGVTVGYLIWRNPAAPAAPSVAALRPAPAATPPPADFPPLPEPLSIEPPDFGGQFDPAQMPQMQQAMATQMIDYAYTDLFSQLDLTPAQAEGLKGVLAERMTAMGTAMQALFQNGGGLGAVGPEDFQQIGDQVEAQFANQISRVVGAENAQQIQAYDANLRQTFQGGFGGGGFPGN